MTVVAIANLSTLGQKLTPMRFLKINAVGRVLHWEKPIKKLRTFHKDGIEVGALFEGDPGCFQIQIDAVPPGDWDGLVEAVEAEEDGIPVPVYLPIIVSKR